MEHRIKSKSPKYGWSRRTRTAVCRLCGKPFVTTSARQRYCHGEECDALLAECTARRKKKLRQVRKRVHK